MLIGLAGLSLWGTSRAWKRLRSGEGRYEDLLDVTGVFERRELLKIPGVSVGADRKLRFDPAHLDQLQPRGVAQWLGTPVGDVLTLLSSVASLVLRARGEERWSGALLAAAGVYVLATWIAGLYLVFRSAEAFNDERR